MSTRWGPVGRSALAALMALVVAVVSPAGASGAPAQIPPGPMPCLVDRPCELSFGLPGADALNPRLAPNGARAVFIREDGGLADLYSVTVAGSPSPKRIDAPAANHDIANVFVSPDSSRVIYTARAEPGGPRHLYSVPLAGPASENVRLSSDVGGIARISPNGRIVVVASAALDRLRAVPIEGPASANVRLTDAFVAGGAIEELAIANNGSVVYLADQTTNDVSELYRVPLTLAPPPDPATVKLNGPLVAGGDVSAYSLELNNTPVAYLADQDTDGLTGLYSVRLGGGGRVKLNRPLPAGWDVRSILTARAGWIPDDGLRIVYVTGGPDGEQLHSALLAGPASTSVRIDDPVTSGTLVSNFVVSPDSARVVYTLRDTGGDRLYRLRSVPIAGPASAGVLLNWPSPDHVFRRVSPDSTRVVNQLGDVLFSSPIQGGALVRINGSEVPNFPFFVDATNTRALYMSASAGQEDIYSAPMSGSGTRYNLTALLDAEVVDTHVELTPGSSQRVVFTAARSDGIHLYSSRLVPGIVPPPA